MVDYARSWSIMVDHQRLGGSTEHLVLHDKYSVLSMVDYGRPWSIMVDHQYLVGSTGYLVFGTVDHGRMDPWVHGAQPMGSWPFKGFINPTWG